MEIAILIAVITAFTIELYILFQLRSLIGRITELNPYLKLALSNLNLPGSKQALGRRKLAGIAREELKKKAQTKQKTPRTGVTLRMGQ
jgi:hypothetical protein